MAYPTKYLLQLALTRDIWFCDIGLWYIMDPLWVYLRGGVIIFLGGGYGVFYVEQKGIRLPV